MKNLLMFFRSIASLLLLTAAPVDLPATDDPENSFYHFGFLHPNGVDIVGYSREKPINRHFYQFYTFGFPSLAAIGINYYSFHSSDGISANIGVGIGSVAYTSLTYRWVMADSGNIQIGAGYTTGIAYSGWYPVLSYETFFSP